MIGDALQRYDDGEIEQALFHPLTQTVIDAFVDTQFRVGPALGHLLYERYRDRLIQGLEDPHGCAAACISVQFVLETFELSHDWFAQLTHHLGGMGDVDSL